MGCYFSSKKPLITASETIQMDSLPGECPYLTKDKEDNTVLSWVRMINDSTTAFCYAVNKNGKEFSVPVVIPNSGNIQPHGENLPKIIFKPKGEIIALWGARSVTAKNKYAGSIFYTQSFNDGKTWTDPRLLVSDTLSFDQRYYDVALLADGEVGVIWLDNRKTASSEGSALYFMKSNGSRGFEGNGTLISQPCCPCCRTKLLVDRNGNIHAIYRGILENSVRDMVHVVSRDAGKTFSTPERISADNWVINGCPHTGPSMTENEEGIHFAWFTGGKNRGCYYTKSVDNGKSFTTRDSVSTLGSHPQITSLPGGDLAIAWDETSSIGDRIIKKIGLQIRDAKGINQSTSFISDANGASSFPVLSAINYRKMIVAYTSEQNERPYVAYQIVTLR
jgi:hypothetical protein